MFALWLAAAVPAGGLASNHYTTKQMDALAARVGKTFWFSVGEEKPPEFFTAAAPNAGRFRPAPEDSFVITDLAGRAQKNPYYEVRFASGKVGFIRPDTFHEALNLTILTADPRAQEKEELEKQTADEKDRIAWIQAQPWSSAVKEAAIRKQPPPGLNTNEVKRVLGPPVRITRLRTPTAKSSAPSRGEEEHWFYKDGSVLIFHNRLLTKTEKPEKK